ncbi:hypothetical protein SRHO_G00014940 [Serrasalmus rhombeus]
MKNRENCGEESIHRVDSIDSHHVESQPESTPSAVVKQGYGSPANRNKHIMIDLGTGNKINWTMEDKQEMIDIMETFYRGARK